MAKNDNKQDAAVASAPVEKAAEKPVQKYRVSKLRENSYALFGVTSSTFDGAFYGKDAEKEYSVEEAKAIINGWLRGGN